MAGGFVEAIGEGKGKKRERRAERGKEKQGEKRGKRGGKEKKGKASKGNPETCANTPKFFF